MGVFLTSLDWNQIGVRKYILTEPLEYKCDIAQKTIVAPAKFVTDGESCPRWLPIINSLFGDCCDEPAVIHDWLYYTADYDRDVADRILLEAMDTIKDLSWWRKRGIYYGLRMFGWSAWNAHRKARHSYNEFYRRNPK